MATEERSQVDSLTLQDAGSILRGLEDNLGSLAVVIGCINGASRTLRYIAGSCSHVQDEGGELVWGEHIHEPSDGGHKFCGPCVAFRALHGIAVA